MTAHIELSSNEGAQFDVVPKKQREFTVRAGRYASPCSDVFT